MFVAVDELLIGFAGRLALPDEAIASSSALPLPLPLAAVDMAGVDWLAEVMPSPLDRSSPISGECVSSNSSTAAAVTTGIGADDVEANVEPKGANFVGGDPPEDTEDTEVVENARVDVSLDEGESAAESDSDRCGLAVGADFDIAGSSLLSTSAGCTSRVAPFAAEAAVAACGKAGLACRFAGI